MYIQRIMLGHPEQKKVKFTEHTQVILLDYIPMPMLDLLWVGIYVSRKGRGNVRGFCPVSETAVVNPCLGGGGIQAGHARVIMLFLFEV